MSNLESRKREAFEAAKTVLCREFAQARNAGSRVRLGKPTSNLFRPRHSAAEGSLDVAAFNTVIAVDPDKREADVGGMTPYDTVVAATLPHGLMPAVVPELKSITVGGAVTGGGIESSSFRYGFVHESVVEMEVLIASGEVVLCRPDNVHGDLFFGFANSYGTLGYALRLRIELVPIAAYVRLSHRCYGDVETYFGEMESVCLSERQQPGGASFVDGTVFGPGEMVRTVGRGADEVDAVSNYKWMRPYYRSLRERKSDCLTAEDYIWRWDTDWFWCARAFGMEFPPLRFVVGACGGLNSRTYWRWRHHLQSNAILRRLGRLDAFEWVIQDVEIPIARAAAFQVFLRETVGIHPFWVCPVMAYRDSSRYPLYATEPDTLYINFGFWGGVPKANDSGYVNRLVEAKVTELGGKKSLYSSSYFSEEEFWKTYNETAYRKLKEHYDSANYFPDLYEKCVRGVG